MKEDDKKEIDPKILDEIVQSIKKIKFGEVVITVFNSKVVQIEETKKKRFE